MSPNYDYYQAKRKAQNALRRDDKPQFKTNAAFNDDPKKQRDFNSFCMILNERGRAKAEEHYQNFQLDGFTYLSAHPEIIAPIPMKFNASISEAKARVQRILSGEPVDQTVIGLDEAKNALAATMAGRHHSADRVGGVTDEQGEEEDST